MFGKYAFIAAPMLVLSSCGETKFAETYAARMGEILKTYSDQVDAKIRAEQQSYVDLAKIYDNANVERIKGAMLLERNRRAVATTDRFVREKAALPTQTAQPSRTVAWISQIHAEIEQFAELDFQQSQFVFTRELDAYKKSIEGLADMAIEQEGLDELKDTLEVLAKPKSLVERLKAAGEFGCEVNRNFQLLDTGQKIDDLTKAISNESDAEKKKSLGKQKTDLEAQKKKLETPCKQP
jgi:hypothetical protein